MADILEEYTIRMVPTDHYICSVILDVDSTEEGYCVEFYSDDSSSSTSFGNSDLSFRLASQLYYALKNCCEETFKEAKQTIEDHEALTDGESFGSAVEDFFWELIETRFESGLVLCDEVTGEIDASEAELNKLIRFIGEWYPASDENPVVSASC